LNENYELAVMLKEGPQRLHILRIMEESDIPLGSRKISERTGIAQTNVVRVLNELESKGAVRELTGRRRTRLYEITEKGRHSLVMMEKLS